MPENRKDPGENTDADHRHPTIINADRQTHGELRKLLSNAFSDKTLKGQEPVLLHYIDLLVERLKEKAAENPVMDIVRWYNVSLIPTPTIHLGDSPPLAAVCDIRHHWAFGVR